MKKPMKKPFSIFLIALLICGCFVFVLPTVKAIDDVLMSNYTQDTTTRTAYYIAESFKYSGSGLSYNVSQVSWFLYSTTSITWYASIRGYDDTINKPNTTVYGTSEPVSLALGGAYAFVNFTFSMPINLEYNINYTLVINCVSTKTYLRINYSGNPFANGYVYYSSDGSTWNAEYSLGDAYFEIRGINLNGIELTNFSISSQINGLNTNISFNSTAYGNSLSGFIFSWDMSCNYANDSWVPYTEIETELSIVTKLINCSIGQTINYKIFTNDSDNVWKVSDIHSFIVCCSLTLVFDSSMGSVYYNGVSYANGTVFNCTTPTLTFLESSNVGFQFLNWSFTLSSINCTDASMLYNATYVDTIYCNFEAVSGGTAGTGFSFALIITLIFLGICIVLPILLLFKRRK